MSNEALGLALIETFSALSEVPLRYNDRAEALRRVTELGQQALRSHACALTLVNLEAETMTYVACAGFDAEFERSMIGKPIPMGNRRAGGFLDLELIAKGELVEKYGLQRDGQGVANPATARKYRLDAVLGYPLKSAGRLIGYFNHFSADATPFGAREKGLLEVFARQALSTIERFDHYQAFDRSLDILNALAQSLLSVPPDEFLAQVPEQACTLLSVPTCIVWRLGEQQKRLNIVAATADVDDAYKNETKLSFADPGIKQFLSRKRPGFLLDVTKPSPHYGHPEEARARGWVSLLSMPMWVQNSLVGLLDVYTHAPRHFHLWEKEFFEAFANYVATALQKADLLRETEETLTSRQRLEQINQVMRRMTQTNDSKALLTLTLDKGLELLGATRGWISQLDVKSGRLQSVAERGKPPTARQLLFGEGITGRALRDGRPTRADDVLSEEWHGVYEEFWPDTRSELAIPMLVSNAEIRVGREVKLAAKPIGVLNIESPEVGAFTQADVDTLLPLARQAALIIDQLEIAGKLTDLRQIERQFAGKRDWDATIQIVLRGITDTLGFEYVNISLVNPELNRITTKYVIGLPEQEVEEFKRLADHALDSNDIQADVVRSKEIEVPAPDDPRFDQKIFKRFTHDQLVRVFLPMIVPSDGRVIGTVEAGYQVSHRKHIFERDVQILQGFVDYAVEALEQKRSGLLDKISHEFRAPVVGIRSNASFMQRRLAELRPDIVEAKFNDMLMDCEILLYQVAELEYILGRPLPVSKPERTLVYRDVIIKTINQLKPVVAEYGFAMTKIDYDPADSARIILNVDRAKLNQVVYNLLINSLKYAEDNLALFTIRIIVDETRDSFIVKFKDWGIGIQKGLEERIFDDGFRTPEAVNKNVNGSGLGLTIARKIMREMGGDLILANNRKPTEFHMILPKSLRGSGA
jgi:GAF domain-containing protein/signal transduction histidine kinase